MTRQLLDTVEKRLDPAHTAVMVIDMQNDFCAEKGYVETGGGQGRLRLPRRGARDHGSRRGGARAPHPRALDQGELRSGPAAGGHADQAAREEHRDLLRHRKLGPRLLRRDGRPTGEPVIEKSCYSAFVGTEVEKELRQRGIRTLVFAGVQTNVCVDSSLRDAVCRGFYAVLASDCVASHTPPLHEATLNNVRFLFGDVIDRAAIKGAWTVEAKQGAT